MGLSAADLGKYQFFSGLSGRALELLAEKVELMQMPPGSILMREGQMGDAFYFVKEGQLEVTRKTEDCHEEKVSVISTGESFGEMALLTCSIRSSSVRAISGVALYRIDKKAFEEIILTESVFEESFLDTARRYSQFDTLKSYQPFELLSADKLCQLLDKMQVKKYAPGECIVVEGERGDAYYIVKTGKIAVLRQKGSAVAKQVAVLGEGDAFGEEALIRDDPRNATCRAIEETTVLCLSKQDFNEIMKTSFLEFVYPEEISTESYLKEYVLIDARIPPEYHEEHISGAVSIPVEVLRQRCSLFDKTMRYVTYCQNDSRGMVAAFLLRNRGFDARCLRGGIGGWEGPLVTGSDGIYLPMC